MPGTTDGSLGRSARPSVAEHLVAAPPANTPAPAYFEYLLVAFGVLLALCVTINPITNVDLWFHLKAGELIVRNHAIPTQDPFSFTAHGQPWIVNAWLSEVILWAIHRLAGPNGLILLESGLVLGAYGILLALWRRMGANFALGIGVLALSVLGGAFRYTPRAELFGLLLASTLLFLLYADKRPGLAERSAQSSTIDPRLAPLVALLILWPNLHMAFLNGVAILAIFLAGDRLAALLAPRFPGLIDPAMPTRRFRQLALFSGLAILGTLLNPYALRAWTYSSLVAGSSVFRRAIEEWLPLITPAAPVNRTSLACLGALALLWAVSLAIRRRVSISSLLLVFFSLGSMLIFRRQALLFTLTVPVALGELWRPRLDAPLALDTPAARRAVRMVVAVGLVATLILLMGFGMGMPLPRSYILQMGVSPLVNPTGAADFVAEHVPGRNLFNTMEQGGYLIWRLYPEHRVFIDGRVDMYGEDLFRLYDALAYRGRDWRVEFQGLGIDACVLGYPAQAEHLDRNLSVRLSQDPHWRLVYWDDISMVFLKDTPRNARTISRYAFRYLNPVSDRSLREGIQRGEFRGILSEVNRQLGRHPEGITAHAVASVAYDLMDMRSEAAREARRALALDPRRLQFASGVVLTAEARKRPSDAEEGIRLLREAHYDRAVPLLRNAVRKAPMNAELRFHLGFALSQQGRAKEAEVQYREAARLAPGRPEIRYNLSCLLARSGRRDEAVGCLSCALKLLPQLREQARQDPDLASLHSDPRFRRMMSANSPR